MEEEDFDNSFMTSRWGEMDEEKTIQSSLEKKRGKVLLDIQSESLKRNEEDITLQPPKPVTEVMTSEEIITDIDIVEGMSEENCNLRQQIVTCISLTDAFFKSQQKDEPDLTVSEKRKIASSLLKNNPATFLARYGKYLQSGHLTFFEQYKDNYEVHYHLEQLKTSSRKKPNIVIKNRRYQAMKEMIEKGNYFSMKEMKSRNPHLFEHLVGKHMSEEERQELEPEGEVCELSTVLMAHMDRDQYSSQRRKDQEAELNAWEEEFSEDEDEIAVENIPTEEERAILQEEFTSTMYQQFMEGRDKDFDYSTVDENSRYDNLVMQERDEEDRYFDADDE